MPKNQEDRVRHRRRLRLRRDRHLRVLCSATGGLLREESGSGGRFDGCRRKVQICPLGRHGEVPQMTNSPQIWEDLAPGTGPYYARVVKVGPPVRYRS